MARTRAVVAVVVAISSPMGWAGPTTQPATGRGATTRPAIGYGGIEKRRQAILEELAIHAFQLDVTEDRAVGRVIFQADEPVIVRNYIGRWMCHPKIEVDVDDGRMAFVVVVTVIGDGWLHVEGFQFRSGSRQIRKPIDRSRVHSDILPGWAYSEMFRHELGADALRIVTGSDEVYLTVFGETLRRSWRFPPWMINEFVELGECFDLLKTAESLGVDVASAVSNGRLREMGWDIKRRQIIQRRREEAERHRKHLANQERVGRLLRITVKKAKPPYDGAEGKWYRVVVKNPTDDAAEHVVIQLRGKKKKDRKTIKLASVPAGSSKHRTIAWEGKGKPRAEVLSVGGDE